MQSPRFETYEEAKKAEADYQKYDTVYTRPNPDKTEGGYIVIYYNRPWWTKPLYGGCPRAR